jgi:ankyrin repeat protein
VRSRGSASRRSCTTLLGGLEKQVELVHALNPEGQTALFVAAQAGTVKYIPALVAAGSEVEARAANGQTALIAAAEEGKIDCVKALLKEKADVRSADKTGNTALHYACIKANLDVLKEVIKQSPLDIQNA